MKITYLIQCHKNFEQVKLLVNLLKLTHSDYLIIHVDAKNPLLRKQLISFYCGYKNIKIVDDPIFVNWSGLSQIKATLKMIDYIYRNSVEFDYCCLLSGEDVVLDVNKFKDYLLENREKSFLEFRQDRAKYFWRINRFNLFRDNKYSQKLIFRLLSFIFIKVQSFFNIKRNNFSENDIYLGSQWFTINKKHMDLIYNFLDDDFINLFNYTSCSDEHFFQILFKKLIKENAYEEYNLRYICFSRGSNSPDYLELSDLKRIQLMDGFFIARKVNYETMIKYSGYDE